jgi:hypothetical protein
LYATARSRAARPGAAHLTVVDILNVEDARRSSFSDIDGIASRVLVAVILVMHAKSKTS